MQSSCPALAALKHNSSIHSHPFPCAYLSFVSEVGGGGGRGEGREGGPKEDKQEEEGERGGSMNVHSYLALQMSLHCCVVNCRPPLLSSSREYLKKK